MPQKQNTKNTYGTSTQVAKPRTFIFDGVFSDKKNQADVFDEIKDYIDSVTDGQKVCIFAYGQTGAGKTYTMEGGPAGAAGELSADAGIIPRSVDLVFRVI